jgi:nitroreductase
MEREEYLHLDETEFRARFRERIHHTLEIQTYEAIHQGKAVPPERLRAAAGWFDLWRTRGLGTELPDYRTAWTIYELAERTRGGGKVDLSAFAPGEVTPAGRAEFFRILQERRSVRHWTDREVPDEVIDRIMEAGTWAPHACNLQSVRYGVIREKEEPGLFEGCDIPPGPVHIVLLQDQRTYRANPRVPLRNIFMDCGAAAQNIVLAVHALGLGGVWLTFDDEMLARLTAYWKLPDHLKITTYVDIGYPAQTPAPVRKLGLDEVVLFRRRP